MSISESRRAMILGLVVLAATSVGWSPSLNAQEIDERVDVRIIQVPVVVWRGGAETVTGLTRDDFEVFVNGERRPIEYFDVLEFDAGSSDHQMSGEAETADEHIDRSQGLAQRRLTTLLFDAAHTHFIHIHRTRSKVAELVKAAAPDDYFAVAVYDGSAVRYLAPFTNDRSVVLRAVETLRPSRVGDPLALGIAQDERTAYARASGIPTSTSSVIGGYSAELVTALGDLDQTIQVQRPGVLVPSARSQELKAQEWLEISHADSWFGVLASVADDLAPLEGIKHVALFSAGGLNTNVRNPRTRLDELHRRFRRAGAVLDVIDVAGLRAPGGDASARIPSLGRSSTPDILFAMALGTGGRVIHGTGVSNAIRMYSETRSVTYLLGLRPVDDERAYNDIVVKVKNQPLFTRVSHRRGYASAAEAPMNLSGVLLADAMLNDLRLEDVTVRVYTDGAGTVEVGMPSDELLAHAKDGWVTVDVYIYVFDEANAVVEWRHRRMRLDEQKTREALAGAELVRRERFDLLPGRYAAKALVRIVERDLLGFQRKDFEVGEPEE